MAETSAWTFVMCHVETGESLEGIFPGGLINRAKKKNLLKDLIYYINMAVKVFWIQTSVNCKL